MKWGWGCVREGRRGLGERGYTRWGIWFIFFNFMPPLPPDVDLYFPVDLWIIRKTNSNHI